MRLIQTLCFARRRVNVVILRKANRVKERTKIAPLFGICLAFALIVGLVAVPQPVQATAYDKCDVSSVKTEYCLYVNLGFQESGHAATLDGYLFAQFETQGN